MCKTHALDFNDGDLWDLQLSQSILNVSLLLYYIFAAVAKWEDDKHNYQLSEKMQEPLQNESQDMPWLCITSTRGSIYFSPKSDAFGVENGSAYT